MKKKVLFVCLGNICRSPTAQGVFDKYIKDRGLSNKFKSDSCDTSSWHVGSPADSRSAAHAEKRGYDLSEYRGRQVDFGDFYEFDLILAMDETNYEDLISIAPSEMTHKVKLMLDYGNSGIKSVPDPYYKGEDGFEEVLDLLEGAINGLLMVES